MPPNCKQRYNNAHGACCQVSAGSILLSWYMVLNDQIIQYNDSGSAILTYCFKVESVGTRRQVGKLDVGVAGAVHPAAVVIALVHIPHLIAGGAVDEAPGKGDVPGALAGFRHRGRIATQCGEGVNRCAMRMTTQGRQGKKHEAKQYSVLPSLLYNVCHC